MKALAFRQLEAIALAIRSGTSGHPAPARRPAPRGNL